MKKILGRAFRSSREGQGLCRNVLKNSLAEATRMPRPYIHSRLIALKNRFMEDIGSGSDSLRANNSLFRDGEGRAGVLSPSLLDSRDI